MGRTAKEMFRELAQEHPEIHEEYDRLGPRFEVINALIRARKARSLSQRELAEQLGVSRNVITRLETGEHSPRLETVYDIAKALGYRLELKLVKERKDAVA